MKEIIRSIAYSIYLATGGRPATQSALLKPSSVIGLVEMSSIVLNKLDDVGLSSTDLFLPDSDCKVYRKADVQKAEELKEVATISYVAEVHDCDDFAAELFGKFAGLLWTNTHALNWFIDETNTFWFIEPQTRKLSQALEGWQGSSVRFAIGR